MTFNPSNANVSMVNLPVFYDFYTRYLPYQMI
jgi:hypothetical protein